MQLFKQTKNDLTTDKKEECLYDILLRKITRLIFMFDLGLMCYIL
jgi:hypothetical protein